MLRQDLPCPVDRRTGHRRPVNVSADADFASRVARAALIAGAVAKLGGCTTLLPTSPSSAHALSFCPAFRTQERTTYPRIRTNEASRARFAVSVQRRKLQIVRATQSSNNGSQQSPSTWFIPAGFVAVAVATRVSNRVLLAPLAAHTYFLALATSLMHLVGYAAWLHRRMSRGFVTQPMLAFVWDHPLLFASFGICEGLFFPLVFYAAARLPGALVQVLNQTMIPFTVVFSMLLLRKKYSACRLVGVALVVLGVMVFALDPAGCGTSRYATSNFFNVALCSAAYGLMALAMVLKESVFMKFACHREKMDGGGSRFKHLDCSLFLASATVGRAITVLLSWPLFLWMTGKPLGAMWHSIAAGLRALVHPSVLPLTLFYWVCNCGLSVFAVLLVRQSCASATVLANVVALPLSALLFCLPLPLLESQPFHWRFVGSLVLVAVGNIIYNQEAFGRTPRTKMCS